MPTASGTQVFDVRSGRKLPADLHGRRFVLGGWTDEETVYGLAFHRSPYGPHRVRLVLCRITLEQRGCEVLRTLRAPAHTLGLFPTGSAATDH